MGLRKFGPTFGAGVVVEEKEAQQAIVPGALGTTAHTGIYTKGPVGKLFRTNNRTEFLFRAGVRIPGQQGPQSGFDFHSESRGAGALYINRVTDGNEKKSGLTSTNRRTVRSSAIDWLAGNAGRWAGKKQRFADVYDSITATTLQLTTVPPELQTDELVGGQLSLDAVAGKSFEIISNTSAGEITLASDIDLITEVNGSANKLMEVKLENSGDSVAICIKDGTLLPTTEWNLEVYLIESGVATLVRTHEDLSSDPDEPRYFEDIVNSDSEAEFLITASDLNTGSITANIRPSNYSGISLTLTDTVLTAQIHDVVPSSVLLATAGLTAPTLGSEILPDVVTLTVSTAGARATEVLTFPGNPSDGDTVVINGKTITFKTVVGTPADEVLIAGSAEGTLDNLVTLINASTDVLLASIVFAEKDTAATMDLFAQQSGTAGNALTTTSAGGGGQPTWGGGTLSSGLDQIWDYVSTALSFVTGSTVTTGVAFAAPNKYGYGFTVTETAQDSAKTFGVGDTLVITVRPLEVDVLVNGNLYPDDSDVRIKFTIASNTANTITVASGSTMTDEAAAGNNFRVEYIQELEAGYDGIAEIADLDFLDAYDTSSSTLRALRGQNLGLAKLATPGITSTAVQKQGVAFGEANNWQYRYEIPANILSETAADEFVNETLGRNVFAVTTFPSYASITNPNGGGSLLEVSMTGMIHGEEADFARNFDGYHKAAAGEDAILTQVLKLPDGLPDTLDEEFLNPRGLNIVKKLSGNFVLWGDRTLSPESEWRFKHQREQMSHYENIFLENFNFIIFALNNSSARERIKPAFTAFFKPELAKGAIVGDSLQDAAPVKIDDENNTPLTTANGDLLAEVGVRLVDTVERFKITMSKLGITEG